MLREWTSVTDREISESRTRLGVVLLRDCDHISGIDPESREETVLFDPRRDAWNEHFDFDAGRFQLLGRTPIGRATIDRLRMNTSYQIEARKYWVEAGLYP